MAPLRPARDAHPGNARDRQRADQRLPRAGTKQALLVSLLRRDGGASIREIVAGTSWKANSVHAALSTLRTGGWPIRVERSAGDTRYRIEAAVPTGSEAGRHRGNDPTPDR